MVYIGQFSAETKMCFELIFSYFVTYDNSNTRVDQ